MSALERALCAFGFAVMTVALVVDVGARFWSRAVASLAQGGWVSAEIAASVTAGGGVLGAPQVAVIGMTLTALFGLGLAAEQGAELRARMLDRIWPATWSGAIDRWGSVISAIMLGVVAGLCAAMAAQSLALGDVSSVLRMPIWPVQATVAAAFALPALRYALYAAYPELRPSLDAAPETPEREGGPQ